MIKSLYYQFVNHIQSIPAPVFAAIWMVLLACVFICVMRFFKIYNGSQKKFEKGSLIFIAVLLFAIILFLTYVRK